jgi:hypothetical protein
MDVMKTVVLFFTLLTFYGCSEDSQEPNTEYANQDTLVTGEDGNGVVPTVDTLYFADIANSSVSEYIYAGNIQFASTVLDRISEPEQYYIKAWFARFVPDIIAANPNNEEKVNEFLNKSFQEAHDMAKGIAEEQGISADELKEQFEKLNNRQ